MESRSFTIRTYGKNSGVKRKLHAEPSDADDSQKRRKITSETLNVGSVEESTEEEDSPPPRGRPRITYSSQRNARTTSLQTSVAQSSPSTPSKSVRPPSYLFDSVPSGSSPSNSPKKLFERMLSRSKTESSIGSGSMGDGRIERTPSLPGFPLDSPSRNAKGTLNDVGNPSSVLPLPPIPPSTSTRTYAGKSRSFLVSLPASGISASSIASFAGANEEEDDLTRESYASLRTRFGIDDSEDDPYPQSTHSPSRSRSHTTTPIATPRKNGKNKLKLLVEPRPLQLPNGMMNPLKSITELRSKGESRRFLDEVGYLFEGMDSNGGIGLKRASALEIATRFCNVDFARKTKAADFIGKVWTIFLDAGAGKGEDKILDTLLVFLAALIARDAASLTDLAATAHHSPSTRIAQEKQFGEAEIPLFSDVLFTLLASINSGDPLTLVAADNQANDTELRKLGISQKDCATLRTIHKTITTASLFSQDTLITTPLMITSVLQGIPPMSIPARHLPSLLASLRQSLDLSMLHSASSTASGSLSRALILEWPHSPSQVPYYEIRNHLRLLDTFLLGQWNNDDESTEQETNNEHELEKAKNEWLVDELLALSVCAEIRMKNNDEGNNVARACLEIALRVLVSLTHSDKACGQKILDCEFGLGLIARIIIGNSRGIDQGGRISSDIKAQIAKVEPDQESESPDNDVLQLDLLCLALGLLTNVVQVVDNAKVVIEETRLDPSCTLRKRACLKSCTCPKSISVIQILVLLYSQQLSTSPTSETRVKLESNSPPPREAFTNIDATEANAFYLLGHLAVLFGLLMRGSSLNQKVILGLLPPILPSRGIQVGKVRGGDDRLKVNKLVEQARDFIAFYAAINGAGAGNDEKDGKVGKDILRFLVEYRDGL